MKEALKLGGLAGLICLILGLICHWISPFYPIGFAIGVALGTAIGNFFIYYWKLI